MARTVFCIKLGQELEGLEEPPQPDELGQRIFENVSKEAWKMWLSHQIMLINEYRLNLADPKANQFLDEQMEQYFFGGGAETPPDYVPQNSKSK
ncbi:MAG TPA: oxidative damage protection protein [Bacteroidetes bacterium]|nr:oxidative damage protection protein [Bacteroidota bacterium]